MQYEWIENGGVTSPRGWLAGAAYANIKKYGSEPRFDVGLLYSEVRAAAAGVFTTSRVCGAPVSVSKEHLSDGHAQGLVVNSGCSNVAMGARGLSDARRMTELAAGKFGVLANDVLVGSTGVIGRPLPMADIQLAIENIELSSAGGEAFARAIMTTDTVPKSRALSFEIDGRRHCIGGVAKGAGMAHPNMATVFCFLTSDFSADPAWLRQTLKSVADVSLNMLDIDMDTSTSDCMLVLANGAAGGQPIDAHHPAASQVEAALRAVSIELTRDLARDGEGAKTLIEATVSGAKTLDDARRAARTIVSSPLVKTMVTGRDANLGRLMMALGRSGAELEVDKISIWLGDVCAFQRGEPTQVAYDLISATMAGSEVVFRADLGLGRHSATAWGCDLTEGYVRINADYTT